MFCVRAAEIERSAQYNGWQQLWAGGGRYIIAVSSNEAEEKEGTLETDLRFWELHRLGPYLVVQSQYVLVNKRALRGRRGRKNNSKAHWITAPEGQHTVHVSLKTKWEIWQRRSYKRLHRMTVISIKEKWWWMERLLKCYKVHFIGRSLWN